MSLVRDAPGSLEPDRPRPPVNRIHVNVYAKSNPTSTGGAAAAADQAKTAAIRAELTKQPDGTIVASYVVER